MTDASRKIEDKLHSVLELFLKDPLNYFSEYELHPEFYGLCRGDFGDALPRGGDKPLKLFRQEYNTIWRYIGDNENPYPFARRYVDRGIPGRLDFAVLRREFVEKNTHLMVVNKDENRRRGLRLSVQDDGPVTSAAIEVSVEFKMLHVTKEMWVTDGVGKFQEAMEADSRKMALEGIPEAFAVGFSHGPLPDDIMAKSVALGCINYYKRYKPDGSIRVLLATPQATFLAGDWSDPAKFPGAVEVA